MRMLMLLSMLVLPAAAAEPLNVVMIIGDDQGYADYGFMGHRIIQTPRIDKLAASSLVFERGHVPTSLCRASLATMITGLYPHQHRMTSNDPPDTPGKTNIQSRKDPEYIAARNAMTAIFEESPNLAKLLAKSGHVSFQSGKWWEGNACRCGGFTEGMTIGDPSKGGRHGDAGLAIGRQSVKPVVDFMAAAVKDQKPFFVWYAPMMPHQPHTPPERLLAKYRNKTPSLHVAKYWAMCEWFDETVGSVLDAIEAQGVAKSTLVIYLHDNGWIQDPDTPTFAAKSKKSPYEGGLRTPILVHRPGTIAPAKSKALASSIDLAPTILAANGLKPTAAMPGINLLDADALAKRDTLTGEIFEHTAVDIRDPAKNLLYRWIIVGTWKLIVPTARVKDGTAELYDLSQDPAETKNLAAANPARVAELNKALDTWWTPKFAEK
jgi:arylsulfatase A-like enzyme